MEDFMELYLKDGWHLINPREIRRIKYFQKHPSDSSNRELYPPDEKFEDKSNEYYKGFKKYIRIEMFKEESIEIVVNNDDIFNYIYKNLSRKFNLNIRTQKIEEGNVIKLYEKGLTKEEITKILHIRFTLVEKIIDSYKNKNT
jgi:hypothetical protein